MAERDDIITQMQIGSPNWLPPPVPMPSMPPGGGGVFPEPSMPEEIDWSPQQIAGGIKKGVGMAYDIARTPLTSSEDITRQFQEMAGQPGIGRSMTAQPIDKPAVLKQGQPYTGMHKAARLGENIMGMAGDVMPLGIAMTGPQVSQRMKVFAKSRARFLGTKPAKELAQMDKLRKWVPQWVWDHAQDIRPTSGPKWLGGQYWRGKKNIPSSRGGRITLNVSGKSPAGSGSHEVGHLVTDTLRNYSRGNPELMKLSNRIGNMDRIQKRAFLMEERLNWLAKHKGLDKRSADYLERLRTQAYISTPEESMARAMRTSFEKGENFDKAVRKHMKKSMDEYTHHEAVLDFVEKEGVKMAGPRWKDFEKGNPEFMQQLSKMEKGDIVKGMSSKKVNPTGVKGLVGRETLETSIGDVLQKAGRSAEEIKQVESSLQYATPAQLKKFLDKIKTWRK